MSNKKRKYVNFDVIFMRCLIVANITKLAFCLIFHIKEHTNLLESKGYLASIDYNDDKINRECFHVGPSGKQTTRALENLTSKNIVFLDRERKKIRINYNPKDWMVTDAQHKKIVEIVNNEELYFNI